MTARVRVRSTPKHGTVTEYTVYGCRCDACREVWRTYWQQRRVTQAGYRTREEFLAEVRANRQHGSLSLYRAGCRCDDCRRASADHRHRFRKRKAEREGREYAPDRDWVLDYRLGRVS